jgi:hypothetical protein
MAYAAGQRRRPIVREHIAVQGVDRGIVDVGFEHTLAQVIQNHQASHTTQASKGFLVQLRPDLRTRAEHQQPHRLAAVAQSQHKQTRATVFPALGIARQGTRSVIDLTFFAGFSLDHRAGFRRLLPNQMADETLDTLIATGEAAAINQVLPDRLGVAAP